MHISLDSALGRQRRLNSVGESVFQIAPDAAAGYSLRSLTGGDPSVVRVRRESDNGERDFNASGVSSGELVNWVNQQVTPPLDLRTLTATGRDGPIIEAAAAYSLRNLSDSYAGDVVEVRRNTDGALKDFKASEVTDGTLAAWVNTSFANALPLDTAGAAAAAYSLRNLSSSYTGSVVEVRRSSDGEPRSFTAAEVTDGTLEAWVAEEQVGWNVQPTWDVSSGDGVISSESSTATTSTFSITTTSGDSFVRQSSKPNHVIASSGDQVVANITLSGFDAPVSARLRTSGTNTTVAQQTLSNGTADYTFNLTGSAGYFAFTSIEATSGATLTINSIKVIGKSGTVSKWYDQSGNDNHATQGTPASQPKIVDGGSLVTGGILSDGAGTFLELDSALSITDEFDIFFTGTATASSWTTLQRSPYGFSTNSNYPRFNDDSYRYTINNTDSGTINYNGGFTIGVDTPFLYNFNRDASDSVGPQINGTAQTNRATLSGTHLISQLFRRGANTSQVWDGTMSEMIFYNSDQSDKRRAIEENIGSTYGITLTSSKDGTVSKWYDQSTTSGVPNAKHAVQTDAASQPKIVDAGALVTGGLDFDGVNDQLNLSNVFTGTGGVSTFIVGNADSTGVSEPMFVQGDNSIFGNAFVITSEIAFRPGGNTIYDDTFIDANSLLLSTIVPASSTSADALMFLDGGALGQTSTTSTTLNYGNQGAFIGNNFSGSAFYDGRLSEIIIYNSDQTDNRTALEANIGETYGIAGIPAYDNTVNGFVETWYDQSGNGNNATQLTAGSQPKIVDAGSLVASGIDFDGVDDTLFVSGNPVITANSTGTYSTFSVQNTSTTASGYLFGNASPTNGSSLLSKADSTFVVSDRNNGSKDRINRSAGENLLSSVYNNNDVEMKVNGGGSTIDTAPYTFASGTSDFRIGSRNPNNIFLDGIMSEVIIYNSDQSANRLAIEANINNQYDIY